ncbi:MAG: septum formation protein Maf [Anaerolineales bacterium]|nr:septum formation protein Maf [Anaerolineales bacterium]
MNAPIVLASSSPRRKALLALAGAPFEVQAADINEDVHPGEDPLAYVRRLAEEKAAKAAEAYAGQDVLIIAADTTVANDGHILGKPADGEEARQMLSSLRGREHMVYSGIAVLRTASGEMRSDVATTSVPMRAYSGAEIEAYIATGDPLDKAGAYAIQHPGFHPVAEMEGCRANVVGLPLCHLKRNLEKWNHMLPDDLPAACQAHLQYDCPVSEAILEWRQ